MLRFAARRTPALAAAIAVLSHFLLDGIAHGKGLPIADGILSGLGLWRNLSVTLAVEAAMAGAGLWLYWLTVKQSLLRARIGMPVYITALTIFLFAGQALATEPPSRNALIAGRLMSPPLIAAIACWLDRHGQADAQQAV